MNHTQAHAVLLLGILALSCVLIVMIIGGIVRYHASVAWKRAMDPKVTGEKRDRALRTVRRTELVNDVKDKHAR